jgi:hypothetical protein
VLVNFFTTNPSQSWACVNNSSPLIAQLRTCYDASAKRWPNFIAVDFYMVHTCLSSPYVHGRLHQTNDMYADDLDLRCRGAAAAALPWRPTWRTAVSSAAAIP